MYKWILPTLSEVLVLGESTLTNCPSEKVRTGTQNCQGNENASVRAEREWRGAISALEQLLLQSIDSEDLAADDFLSSVQGLVLTGPVPVLSHIELLSCLPTWIFTTEMTGGMPFQLPPAKIESSAQNSLIETEVLNTGPVLPLLAGDPLASEQFCLVLTAHFSLVMVLGELAGVPAFLFSFDPEVVEQAWRSLRARALLNSRFSLDQLDALVKKYYPIAPDYRLVTQFSRLLLKHLPEETRSTGETEPSSLQPPTAAPLPPRPDVELLQAFAHEVRTPLTTIRTLTRLLLKRRDMSVDAVKRLEIIDHECTAQIDRMELLFRAAELEISTGTTSTHLTAMSLDQVLQQSIPRWHQSANRRNLTLDVVLPQQLPTVVSDPKMLDQVLTGLIENFTRSLPAGSHIQIQVIPAGDQLKLQLLPQCSAEENSGGEFQPAQFHSGETTAEPLLVPPPICKSLGQLLMFQPETGNISLNLAATKHLFQAIGGKLIVRQRPHQGEVLTIFLPLEVSNSVQLS